MKRRSAKSSCKPTKSGLRDKNICYAIMSPETGLCIRVSEFREVFLFLHSAVFIISPWFFAFSLHICLTSPSARLPQPPIRAPEGGGSAERLFPKKDKLPRGLKGNFLLWPKLYFILMPEPITWQGEGHHHGSTRPTKNHLLC